MLSSNISGAGIHKVKERLILIDKKERSDAVPPQDPPDPPSDSGASLIKNSSINANRGGYNIEDEPESSEPESRKDEPQNEDEFDIGPLECPNSSK